MKNIGLKLKDKREENGLSIEEVAEDLKMRPSQISSIEEGKTEDFKDVFYLKYFIRDYAKYLGLDSERILDEFKGDTSSEDAARTKAFMKDEKVDQYIRNKMAAENNGMAPTEEEIKQEKESMRDYVNEGLTDTAEIYRAKKAEKYVDRDQAAKIARLAKERKITSKELGDEKQYKAKVQDFTQEFMDKRGLDEEAARKAAEHTLNVMKAQVGQQHNLKPKTDSGAASKATTGTSSGKKKSTSRKTKK